MACATRTSRRTRYHPCLTLTTCPTWPAHAPASSLILACADTIVTGARARSEEIVPVRGAFRRALRRLLLQRALVCRGPPQCFYLFHSE